MTKTVAITGAMGTLGQAVLEEFAKGQYWHVGTGDDDYSCLSRWRVHGCSRAGSVLAMIEQVDVTHYQKVNEWMHSLGELEALVTCAGVSLVKPADNMSDLEWLSVIDTNLNGSYYAARAAFDCGAKRVVFIGSIHGCTPTNYPQRAAYTTSKAGLVGLTRALAVEWGPLGVAVNCIAPGHLPKLMDGTGAGQALLDAARARTPTGRLTTAKDVAEVAFWLCNDAPLNLTGQVITIDGGFTLNTLAPELWE